MERALMNVANESLLHVFSAEDDNFHCVLSLERIVHNGLVDTETTSSSESDQVSVSSHKSDICQPTRSINLSRYKRSNK